MLSRRLFVCTLLAGAALASTQPAWLAGAAPNQFAINIDADGRALKGFDTVAYFTEGRAARGSETYSLGWQGARWLFTSARHRELFAADPERYAPRIGRFCAVGATNGRMADVDPQMWLIVRDRLYLYINAAVRDAARADLETSAAEAEANWMKMKPEE